MEDRQELYQRYKEAISQGIDRSSFDEDDLVEVFDYAGDYNDDYVRLEVLLDGARRYPDSEDLLVRRGYFYSDLDTNTADAFMADCAEQKGLLWDILRLYDAGMDTSDMSQTLDRLLDMYKGVDLTDEEVIRLTNLACESGCVDWIKERLDSLRQRTPYLPTLLYEVAHIYEATDNTADALPLYRELTELEPFNQDFWSCLASAAYDVEDFDEAESANEYALAIDPDNTRCQLLRSMILYRGHHDFRKAFEAADALYEKNKNDGSVSGWIVKMVMEEDRGDLLEKYLRSFIEARPTSNWAVTIFLKQEYSGANEVIERFFRSATSVDFNPETMGDPCGDVTTEHFWNTWAFDMINSEAYGSASTLLHAYKTLTGKPLTDGLRMVAMAFMGVEQFESAAGALMKWYAEKPSDQHDVDVDIFTMSMFAYVLYRVGELKLFDFVMEQLGSLLDNTKGAFSSPFYLTTRTSAVVLHTNLSKIRKMPVKSRPSDVSLMYLLEPDFNPRKL